MHNGMANLVSFIDYLAGRRQGYYLSNPIPNYLVKNQSQVATGATTPTRPVDVMKDELFRVALRKQFGSALTK